MTVHPSALRLSLNSWNLSSFFTPASAPQVLQDASSVGYTIILDFTSLLSLEGISVPWLLDALKIFDTLKTLWEGGASRCKRVVAYGVNSWAVLLYQRVSSLLALSNGTSE